MSTEVLELELKPVESFIARTFLDEAIQRIMFVLKSLPMLSRSQDSASDQLSGSLPELLKSTVNQTAKLDSLVSAASGGDRYIWTDDSREEQRRCAHLLLDSAKALATHLVRVPDMEGNRAKLSRDQTFIVQGLESLKKELQPPTIEQVSSSGPAGKGFKGFAELVKAERNREEREEKLIQALKQIQSEIVVLEREKLNEEALLRKEQQTAANEKARVLASIENSSISGNSRVDLESLRLSSNAETKSLIRSAELDDLSSKLNLEQLAIESDERVHRGIETMNAKIARNLQAEQSEFLAKHCEKKAELSARKEQLEETKRLLEANIKSFEKEISDLKLRGAVDPTSSMSRPWGASISAPSAPIVLVPGLDFELLQSPQLAASCDFLRSLFRKYSTIAPPAAKSKKAKSPTKKGKTLKK